MEQSTDTATDLRGQADAAHRDLQQAVGERFTTIDSAAYEAMRQIADLRAELTANAATVERVRKLCDDMEVHCGGERIDVPHWVASVRKAISG